MQLTLPIQLREDVTFNTFHAGQNQKLINYLQAFVRGTTEQYVYLWSRVGEGCSHLLQACCHYQHQLTKTAVYLPLRYKHDLSPAVLEGLEQVQLICIDDIELIARNKAWEEALFHFYNRLQTTKNRLLIGAHNPPAQIKLRLKDLHSRLKSSVILSIQQLDDEGKLDALQLRAQLRGLQLADEVGRFLLARYPRSLLELFSALEKLDQASLAEQRRLTIPFVKQVLII